MEQHTEQINGTGAVVLNAAQVASMANVSTWLVLHAVRRGDLRSLHAPGNRRVLRVPYLDAVAWAKKQEAKAAEQAAERERKQQAAAARRAEREARRQAAPTPARQVVPAAAGEVEIMLPFHAQQSVVADPRVDEILAELRRQSVLIDRQVGLLERLLEAWTGKAVE